MRRLRILMLIPQLGYGGAEGAFLRVANYLSRHAEVTIALMARDYGEGPYSTSRSQTNLPVVMLDGDRIPAVRLLAKVARWGRMLQRLRDLKNEHDVAISFLSGANLLNALSGPKHKTIVSERGSKLHHLGLSWRSKFIWLRVLDPIIYWKSAKIVSASAGYGEEISTISGARNAAKIVPIEGSINAFQLVQSADSPVDDDIAGFCCGPTAIFCGRIDRGKGIDLLIPAISSVRARLPSARLLMIGDGPLLNEIVDLCGKNNLSVTFDGDPAAAVFLAGYRNAPIRNLRLGSVFIFPSLHEGLPNALIEAVAAGIPILAADCPWGPRSVLSGPDDNPGHGPIGLPRRLAHGTLLPTPVNAGAIDIWSREIIKALRNPSRRRSREQCRAAIARFDIEVTGPRWVSLVTELSGLCPQRID